MASFQQSCPNCHAVLELPEEAHGKSAICPACQHRFIASSAIESATKASPPSIIYRDTTIETAVDDTRWVFASRRRPLLLPFLIPSAFAFFGLLLPLSHISSVAAANQVNALIEFAVLSPWFVILTSYVIWFALNLANDICELDRTSQRQRSGWMVPSARSYFGVMLVVAVTSVFLGMLFALNFAVMNVTAGLTSLANQILIIVLVLAVSFVGVIIYSMLTWPIWPLVCLHGFSRTVVSQALAIARVNLMTSLMVVVIAGIMLGLGFSTMCLGLPVLCPLVALLLLVATCRISGERVPVVDDPEGEFSEPDFDGGRR